MPAADSGGVGAGLPCNPGHQSPAPEPPRTAAGAADHSASELGASDQQLQEKKKSLETKGTQRKGSKLLLAYTAPPDDLLAAVKRCAARPPPTAPC